MNCKPGDLAIVIGGSDYAGRIVEVLHAAPSDDFFTLPDGYRHRPVEPGCWVIRFLGSPVKAPVGTDYASARYRITRYGSCRDAGLRPLRGLSDEEAEQIRNSRKVSA